MGMLLEQREKDLMISTITPDCQWLGPKGRRAGRTPQQPKRHYESDASQTRHAARQQADWRRWGRPHPAGAEAMSEYRLAGFVGWQQARPDETLC